MSYKLVFALAPLLTACSNIYQSDFDCPAGKGTPCASMSKVNQMVDNGQLPRTADGEAAPAIYFPEAELWEASQSEHQVE